MELEYEIKYINDKSIDVKTRFDIVHFRIGYDPRYLFVTGSYVNSIFYLTHSSGWHQHVYPLGVGYFMEKQIATDNRVSRTVATDFDTYIKNVEEVFDEWEQELTQSVRIQLEWLHDKYIEEFDSLEAFRLAVVDELHANTALDYELIEDIAQASSTKVHPTYVKVLDWLNEIGPRYFQK